MLYFEKIKLPLITARDNELRAATSYTLYFTTQKNLWKGDIIAKSSFLHYRCYPVKALVWIVLPHNVYFVQKHIPFDGNVLFISYYFKNKWLCIKPSTLTKYICDQDHACLLSTSINADDLTTQSLQVGDAMAILNGNCDTNQMRQQIFNSDRYTFLPPDSVPSRY